MRLKLDENLSQQLKPALIQLGHNVETAADEGLLGQRDEAVGDAARREGRMLLTLDLDFSDIRTYPPGSHPGILLFRPATFGPLEVNRFVADFMRGQNLAEFEGCLVVVETRRVRVRRPGAA